MHDEDDLDPDDRPSKSQRKRDCHALQDLGEKLAELPNAQFKQVPLTDELREAVELARRIEQHGGRKRQLKFVGKLLRRSDTAAIEETLARFEQGSARETALLHRCERWRERLLDEGDAAVTALVDEHPGADVQHLRQLVRNARRERDQDKPPKTARELFRYVRDLLSA